VAQSTDAQSRLVAVQFADELLNTALVDEANAACYTLPAVGVCGNPAAAATPDAWKQRLLLALPTTTGATSELAANRLKVTIQWAGKAGANTDGTTDTHRVEVTTDVTP